MQGQLRKEPLACSIQTECAHCGQTICIQIDSDLNYSLCSPGAEPVVFAPTVDFERLEDPSIIDAF